MTRCRVIAAQEEGSTPATLGPVDADRAAIDVLGIDFELQAHGKRPVGLDDDMRHARQVCCETINVKNVPALKPCADVDDGKSAAGVAANQLGGKINVGIGQYVRSIANRQRTIRCSAKGFQHGPYHDRFLR